MRRLCMLLCVVVVSACSSDDDAGSSDNPVTGGSGGQAGAGGVAGGGSAGMAGAGAAGQAGSAGAPDAGTDASDGDSGSCPPPSGSFAVSDVIGSVADGQPLVICGDLFGDLGPDIVLFADMENGVVGEPVAASAPGIGAWIGGSSLFADDAARSGSMSMLVADADINDGKGLSTTFALPDADGPFGYHTFDEFFASWAIRDLGDFPGNDSSPTDFSSDSSAKDLWMMLGNRGDNYDYSCSQGECNGNDIVLATHTGQGSFKIDGNNTSTNWWLPSFWQFQAWNSMSTYLRVDPNDPYGSSTGVFEHVSPGSGYTRDEYDGQIFKELDGLDPVWDRLKFGAWYRAAGDVRRVMDDLYLAVGPGAAARVEIANAAQIEDATKIAVSMVTWWSSVRIEAMVHLGDLDPESDSLYLFVVDENNQRSAGFALD